MRKNGVHYPVGVGRTIGRKRDFGGVVSVGVGFVVGEEGDSWGVVEVGSGESDGEEVDSIYRLKNMSLPSVGVL